MEVGGTAHERCSCDVGSLKISRLLNQLNQLNQQRPFHWKFHGYSKASERAPGAVPPTNIIVVGTGALGTYQCNGCMWLCHLYSFSHLGVSKDEIRDRNDLLESAEDHSEILSLCVKPC